MSRGHPDETDLNAYQTPQYFANQQLKKAKFASSHEMEESRNQAQMLSQEASFQGSYLSGVVPAAATHEKKNTLTNATTGIGNKNLSRFALTTNNFYNQKAQFNIKQQQESLPNPN